MAARPPEPVPQEQPTPAERARTAVAHAPVATMITGRCASRSLTVVGLGGSDDGMPVVRLEPSSPVVRSVARCPVATLSFPGHGEHPAFGLTGTLERLRDRAGHDALRYRLVPLSARYYGSRSVSVPLSAYLAAEPDPLAPYAARTLTHLEHAHGDRMLRAVRARLRPHALAVVPRELDRYGLGLGVVVADGVETLRLPFVDGPVSSPVEAGHALRRLLSCGCRRADDTTA